jgi:hypothetical protein
MDLDPTAREIVVGKFALGDVVNRNGNIIRVDMKMISIMIHIRTDERSRAGSPINIKLMVKNTKYKPDAGRMCLQSR